MVKPEHSVTKVACRAFVLLLLLNSEIAYAYLNATTVPTLSGKDVVYLQEEPAYLPAETPPEITGDNNNGSEDTVPLPDATPTPTPSVPSRQSFSCNMSSMTPAEAQKILDLVREGMLGETIGSGTKPNPNREELSTPTVLIPAPGKSDEFVKMDVPARKIKPYEVAHVLNDWFRGPYAFGLVLTDTLRVGRCEMPDLNACALTERRLRLRNSGEGIAANFKPLLDFIKRRVPFMKNKDLEDLSDEDYAKLREALGYKGGVEDLKMQLNLLEDAPVDQFGNLSTDPEQDTYTMKCNSTAEFGPIKKPGAYAVEVELTAENCVSCRKTAYFSVSDKPRAYSETLAEERPSESMQPSEEASAPSILDVSVSDASITTKVSVTVTCTTDDEVKVNFVKTAEVKNYRRLLSKIIPNSIMASNFSAYMLTTCNGSDCIISVYSMFDKYYNAWFSAEMVISMGVPTLLHRARKLFVLGSSSKIFPWTISDSKIAQWFRRKFATPDKFYGRYRAARIVRRAYKYPKLGEIKSKLFEPTEWTGGYLAMKGNSFRTWMTGDFQKFTAELKDPKLQENLIKMVRDMKGFMKTQKALWDAAEKEYLDVVKKYGYGSIQEIQARVDYGRKISKLMLDYDAHLSFDVVEWWMRDESSGLYKYALKRKGADDYFLVAADSANLQTAMEKYIKDGHWGGPWRVANERGVELETTGMRLNLYEPSPFGRKVGEVSIKDIEKYPAKYREKFVKLDNGELVKIDDATIPLIKEHLAGKAELYDAGWEKSLELTPEEFATKLIYNTRLNSNLRHFTVSNLEAMERTLIDKGFLKRRYANLLDRAMSRQDELIKDYAYPKGGAKWTAYTYAYWWGKRGMGMQEVSGYMLANQYKRISWPVGSARIYEDAYIDFFSNEGSDEGDIFKQVINNLPWEWVYQNVAVVAGQWFKPVQETYYSVTGRKMRTRVENLAFYATTPADCEGCGVAISSTPDLRFFEPNFVATREFSSHILEDVVSEDAKLRGTTLITFSHHTDIAGELVGEESSKGTISLTEAIKNKTTCRDKVESHLLSLGLKGKDIYAVGGILALGESLSYFLFGYGAIFGTLVQQILVAPAFQDCVDADEGYFTHVFAPSKLIKPKKGPAELSTEKVQEAVVTAFDKLKAMFESEGGGYTAEAAKKLDEEVRRFVKGAEQTDLVQANVHTRGFTSGRLKGEMLFSFWFKGESTPAAYKTKGKKVITGKDGDTAIIIDWETGKVYAIKDVNGEKVVELITDNPDIARLASTNTAIPAEELPQRYTLLGLTDATKEIMYMDVRSDMYVTDVAVWNCIRQAVKFQTGLELTSRNLTTAFGKVQAVVTDTHPTIKAWPEQRKIIAEGTPRRMVQGENVKLSILANRSVKLVDSSGTQKPVGLLQSIQFEHGVMVYKPDTHELIIWLKRHAGAVLDQGDVQQLYPKKAETVNPLTNCPEPAIDLEAIPIAGSDVKAYRVEQFNKSLAEMGPFQVLETTKHRFVFFSKLENGECVPYFKVINKDTGESYEAPIKSMIVTPEGIKITDGNGREHMLRFLADNGVPKIAYNNLAPELFTHAQGRNGSFWYDPEKGKWYAENSQLLPLIEAIKNGLLTTADEKGRVLSKAGDNILNVQAGPSAPLFNLSGTAGSNVAVPLVVVLFVIVFVLLRLWVERRIANS